MLSLTELKKIFIEIKTSDSTTQIPEDNFQMILEYITNKFSETSLIFSKFDNEAISQFCLNSELNIYEENQEIFKKGEVCNSYYFLLYGDINLYDEEYTQNNPSNKLLKTISAGTLYGHKIRLNFNYFAVAKNLVNFIKIKKETFNNLIEKTNIRKDEFKSIFLKKFFPKFRMYSEDIIKSLKGYFIREEYEKNSKIIVDNEFDEFIYLIVKGNLAITKSIKRFKNLKDNLQEANFNNYDKIKYVILENLSKGDIFGVYSAITHHKNNFTVVVTSEKAEVYKISKAHCLYYFGGSQGIIPEALKGYDTIQQMSINHKIEFLEKNKSFKNFGKFEFIFDHLESNVNNKKVLDESEIENSIKDAWKELEDLGSKISAFKMNLLKGNTNKTNVSDLFNKIKTQENEVEVKDNTKLMGFGTNRIVGKTLNKNGLTANQTKGMSTLQNICGVKKIEDKVDVNMIKKISELKTTDAPRKNKLFSDLDDDLLKNKKEVANANNSNSVETILQPQPEKKKKILSLKNLIE